MTTKKIRERNLRPYTSHRKIRFESLEARKLMAADIIESVITVDVAGESDVPAIVDESAMDAKEVLIKCEDFPPPLPMVGDDGIEPAEVDGKLFWCAFTIDDQGDLATEDANTDLDFDKPSDDEVYLPKEGLISRYQNAWWNEDIPSDVDNDGSVSVLDALNVINAINSVGVVPVSELSVRVASMSAVPGASSVGQVDINNDGYLTPIDALIVVNQVNQRFVETQSANSQFKSSEAAMELLADNYDQPSSEYFIPREILVDLDDTLGFESGDAVGEPGSSGDGNGDLALSSLGIDAFWAAFSPDLEVKRKA